MCAYVRIACIFPFFGGMYKKHCSIRYFRQKLLRFEKCAIILKKFVVFWKITVTKPTKLRELVNKFMVHRAKCAYQIQQLANGLFASTLRISKLKSRCSPVVWFLINSMKFFDVHLHLDQKIVLSWTLWIKLNIQGELDIWIWHKLVANNWLDSISVRESLLKQEQIKTFIERLTTGRGKADQVYEWNCIISGEHENEILFGMIGNGSCMMRAWTWPNERWFTLYSRLKRAMAIKRPVFVNRRGITLRRDNVKQQIHRCIHHAAQSHPVWQAFGSVSTELS